MLVSMACMMLTVLLSTTVPFAVVGTVTTNDVLCTDGWRLLADENDCNAFYSCAGTTPQRRRCPPGLHFSLLLQTCDWPSTAGCIDRRGSTLFKAQGTTDIQLNENDEQRVAAEVCMRVTSNRWHLPFPGDCTRHIKCQPGLQGADASIKAAYATVFTCPATLHFNARLQVCDWPDAAGCDGDTTMKLQKDDNTPKPAVRYKGNKILLGNANIEEYFKRNRIVSTRNAQQPDLTPDHNSSDSDAQMIERVELKDQVEKQTQGEKPSYEGIHKEGHKREGFIKEIIEQQKRKISEGFRIFNQSYSNQSKLNLGGKGILPDEIIEGKNYTQATHPREDLAKKNRTDWKTKTMDDIMKNFKRKLEDIRFDFSKLTNKSEKNFDNNNIKNSSRTYIVEEVKEKYQQMDPFANNTPNDEFADPSNISKEKIENILRGKITNIDPLERSYRKNEKFNTEKVDLETNNEQSYQISPNQVHKLPDKKHGVDVFVTSKVLENFKRMIEKELHYFHKLRPESFHYLEKSELNQTQQSDYERSENERNNKSYVDKKLKKVNIGKHLRTTRNTTKENSKSNADQFDQWNITGMKTPNIDFSQRHGEISENSRGVTNFSADAASNRSQNDAAYFKRIKKQQEEYKDRREKYGKEREIIKNYTNNGHETIEKDNSFEDYHDDSDYNAYHIDILGYDSTETNDDSMENTNVTDDSNENVKVNDFSMEDIKVKDDSMENTNVKDDSNENKKVNDFSIEDIKVKDD